MFTKQWRILAFNPSTRNTPLNRSQVYIEKRVWGREWEKDYAREELVAELWVTLVGNALGFSSRILNNNDAYIDGWISKLKKQPKLIVYVLTDVNKAAKMVLEIVNKGKAQLLMPV